MSPSENADKKELTVFSILRDSECAECKTELLAGDFLTMEYDRPLCMSCADLDHLVYLPRGDVALTRRSRKYSALSPIVLRFSRSRKRYERQGVLVEEQALARAERECLEDADAREAARARAAVRREGLDREYVRELGEHIRRVFPACPAATRRKIAEHACLKYSGRVGRSSAARRFDEEAIELAVQAHARHVHTEYGRLLAGGMDRREARAFVRRDVDRVLDKWRRPS